MTVSGYCDIAIKRAIEMMAIPDDGLGTPSDVVFMRLLLLESMRGEEQWLLKTSKILCHGIRYVFGRSSSHIVKSIFRHPIRN